MTIFHVLKYSGAKFSTLPKHFQKCFYDWYDRGGYIIKNTEGSKALVDAWQEELKDLLLKYEGPL